LTDVTPLSGERVPIPALLPVSRRVSFVYVEKAVVHRDSNAVVVMREDGTVHIPAATDASLLLGPGTRVTHQAMNLLGESGVSVCWTGSGGTPLYAYAPSLANSTRLLDAQARLVSRVADRLSVARKMYAMRFPGEDVSKATMQVLRGMEGARVRRAYREAAAAHGVAWSGRRYDPADWSAGDPINKALSVANSTLYGAVHAAIVAVGCSPGLGFVHTGHNLSFVYDIADLYKAEVTIPAAFRAAADGPDALPSRTRTLVRVTVHRSRIMERAVADIHTLLLGSSVARPVDETDRVVLWDGGDGEVPAGVDYGDDSK
jgi:CRISPR-associated protein Cas1